MKITKIRLGKISAPLRVPFKTAIRTVDKVEDVVIELHTDTGHIGYGEAPPTEAITGDTWEAITGALKGPIQKVLLGREIDELTWLYGIYMVSFTDFPFIKSLGALEKQ